MVMIFVNAKIAKLTYVSFLFLRNWFLKQDLGGFYGVLAVKKGISEIPETNVR